MSWLLFLGCLLVAVATYWLWWRYTHRRMLALATAVPGPPTLPLLGNTLLFLTEPDELLNKVTELSRKYGDYMRLWIGPDLNIFVKDPTDIRYILTSNKVNEKGPLYDLMKTYIGPGILTGGPTWRAHRKIATPSYNKKSVQEYSAVFNREAEELARLLTLKDQDTSFDVYKDVVRTTTQCVCQTLMRLSKEDTQTLRRLDEVVSITPSIYNHIFKRMTRWWLQIPLVYWILGEKAVENNFIKAIDELSSDIISKRRKKMNMEGSGGRGIVDNYALSGVLSDREIKWETFSLFTTSQEASAKIASGVLMFLAHLPEWQEKVYAEIISVLGPADSPVSGEELKRLPLLDMVYKETLRYFAIAPLIQRTVTEDITIHGGAITLPAGTSLVIPIHELHRDPRHWPDPYKVMPERFLPENVKQRDPNAFVPFSLGAMDCLGRVYATALIKTLVVRVLRRVRLEGALSLDHLTLDVAISVHCKAGYQLRVKPREHV